MQAALGVGPTCVQMTYFCYTKERYFKPDKSIAILGLRLLNCLNVVLHLH